METEENKMDPFNNPAPKINVTGRRRYSGREFDEQFEKLSAPGKAIFTDLEATLNFVHTRRACYDQLNPAQRNSFTMVKEAADWDNVASRIRKEVEKYGVLAFDTESYLHNGKGPKYGAYVLIGTLGGRGVAFEVTALNKKHKLEERRMAKIIPEEVLDWIENGEIIKIGTGIQKDMEMLGIHYRSPGGHGGSMALLQHEDRGPAHQNYKSHGEEWSRNTSGVGVGGGLQAHERSRVPQLIRGTMTTGWRGSGGGHRGRCRSCCTCGGRIGTGCSPHKPSPTFTKTV